MRKYPKPCKNCGELVNKNYLVDGQCNLCNTSEHHRYIRASHSNASKNFQLIEDLINGVLNKMPNTFPVLEKNHESCLTLQIYTKNHNVLIPEVMGEIKKVLENYRVKNTYETKNIKIIKELVFNK